MIFKNLHTFLDKGGQKRCTIELLFCTNWVTSIYNSKSEKPMNKFSVKDDRFMIQ